MVHGQTKIKFIFSYSMKNGTSSTHVLVHKDRSQRCPTGNFSRLEWIRRPPSCVWFTVSIIRRYKPLFWPWHRLRCTLKTNCTLSRDGNGDSREV